MPIGLTFILQGERAGTDQRRGENRPSRISKTCIDLPGSEASRQQVWWELKCPESWTVTGEKANQRLMFGPSLLLAAGNSSASGPDICFARAGKEGMSI